MWQYLQYQQRHLRLGAVSLSASRSRRSRLPAPNAARMAPRPRRTMREVSIRGCKECAFSNGGHLFAAVNGNVVHVYSTYTCASIALLR